MRRFSTTICRKWQEKDYETIAVVCRNQHGADWAAKELGQYIEVMESDLEKAVFGSGVMVLPVEYTKGLEFDTVLILDPTRAEYPVDDGHAKLLYVAATRALHELCVLHTEDLTGLIADPVPEKAEEEKPIAGCFVKEECSMGEGQSMKMAQSEAAPVPKAADRRTGAGRERTKLTVEKKTSEPGGAHQRGRISVIQNTSRNLTQESEEHGREAFKNQKAVASQSEFSRNNSFQNISAQIDVSRKSGIKPKQLLPASSTALPAFGDIPSTEKLRPMGHSKIDLSIRWVAKQPDGLYLQSRYGTGSNGVYMPTSNNSRTASTCISATAHCASVRWAALSYGSPLSETASLKRAYIPASP